MDAAQSDSRTLNFMEIFLARRDTYCTTFRTLGQKWQTLLQVTSL